MENSQKWLDSKLCEYKHNPDSTLLDIIIKTTDVLNQYISSPGSKATLGLLEACLNHNKMFIDSVTDLENDEDSEFAHKNLK